MSRKHRKLLHRGNEHRRLMRTDPEYRKQWEPATWSLPVNTTPVFPASLRRALNEFVRNRCHEDLFDGDVGPAPGFWRAGVSADTARPRRNEPPTDSEADA